MSESITALLPMKAHSSRVPRKNFRSIAGKPLFQWILDVLHRVETIGKIVINTDAEKELLASGLVLSDKVVIRTRRPELCGDEVSMNLVLKDDVLSCGDGHYLMTHTTNPLLSEASIRMCIRAYLSELDNCDSLFTVNRHQTRFYKFDATPINHDPNNLVPTQDLEPYFEENSCLYLFSRESFQLNDARICLTPQLIEIPKIEAVDIDEQDDWELAEALLRGNLNREQDR